MSRTRARKIMLRWMRYCDHYMIKGVIVSNGAIRAHNRLAKMGAHTWWP
jgi:hypothetical protein